MVIGTAKCRKPKARPAQMPVFAGADPARAHLPNSASRKTPFSVIGANTQVTRRFNDSRLNVVVSEKSFRTICPRNHHEGQREVVERTLRCREHEQRRCGDRADAARSRSGVAKRSGSIMI